MPAETTQVTLKPWVNVLQIIVPVFLFILGVYIHQVDTSIANVKSELMAFKAESELVSSKQFDMLFKHMTNDEIHTPKSIVVTKPEFVIYQELRNDQMKELRDGQYRLQCLVEQKLKNF